MTSMKTTSTKRRKISLLSKVSPSSSMMMVTDRPEEVTKPIPTNGTCVTCHRALNTSQSIAIVCSRCSSLSCMICSRTCTASMPSQPPTPHLTYSPTPNPSPLQSPHRSALSINAPNTNSSPVVTGKRKKGRDNDDEKDFTKDRSGGYDSEGVGPGCGRILCRNCCYENMQSSTITCFDCFH